MTLRYWLCLAVCLIATHVSAEESLQQQLLDLTADTRAKRFAAEQMLIERNIILETSTSSSFSSVQNRGGQYDLAVKKINRQIQVNRSLKELEMEPVSFGRLPPEFQVSRVRNFKPSFELQVDRSAEHVSRIISFKSTAQFPSAVNPSRVSIRLSECQFSVDDRPIRPLQGNGTLNLPVSDRGVRFELKFPVSKPERETQHFQASGCLIATCQLGAEPVSLALSNRLQRPREIGEASVRIRSVEPGRQSCVIQFEIDYGRPVNWESYEIEKIFSTVAMRRSDGNQLRPEFIEASPVSSGRFLIRVVFTSKLFELNDVDGDLVVVDVPATVRQIAIPFHFQGAVN